MALVGFSGSRSLSGSFSSLARRVVASVVAAGRGVAVGCCPSGADPVISSAAPGALVFCASPSSAGVPRRGALAARSAALVRAVAASGPGAGFVGFVSRPCPAGLLPCAAPFSGLGSGSWASLALAAWLGLPVVVFWCCPGCSVPVLPAGWGVWSPVVRGPFAGGWLLSASARRCAPVQARLFSGGALC